jgi:two-component sensor histidine kinase/HAMP domain-containing protein
MKIKTKLQIIIIVNIMILVGNVSLNLLWRTQADKQLNQQGLIMDLNQDIFERARIREEYFLYREDRSKEQFLLMHTKIAGLLESMLGVFTEPEEKVYLNNMIGFHKNIGDLFNQLTGVDKKTAFHSVITQALRERIISQMLVNAHSMHRDGLKLLKTASEKIEYQNHLVRLYSNIALGLLALFIVYFAWIIIRSITRPLKSLHEGVEIIAEGNLDYKTNIRTSDEIGQLSNAFDSMTENLQKITVSRDELGKEIETRKRAEEKIKASLLEKETMLKEIHHRVKNNLQVISSLLNMQSSYLQDEKAKEMLRNSMDRVSTMARIHTMLYQSADMSRVDFGGFIKDLAGRLRQSHGIAESPVGIHTNVSDVSLTIETSIPCGLILNELVTNALKHAFPEGRGGEINIGMQLEGKQVVLKIQDNGIGFPEALDFQHTKSLGLELVNLLVGQINGTIDLQVEGGTTFTITFPAVIKGA